MTLTNPQVAEFHPLGAEVAGVDLRQPDTRPGVPDLVQLLADRGVVVFPAQHLDDAGFLEFLRSFGQSVFTAGEMPLAGHPDLNVISNVGRMTAPRSSFHVDTSYVDRPPAYTALRAVAVPEQGGRTEFSNQYRAYDTLPAGLRDFLRGRTLTHVVTGVDPGPGAQTSAEHPLFRKHPVTGRTALYITTPARCAAISGLTADETARMITLLHEHSTRTANVLRHRWRPGDVVMWDNGCVMHRADHSGVVGERVMHRGMIDGYAAPRDATP